jgi:hypothetical protein
MGSRYRTIGPAIAVAAVRVTVRPGGAKQVGAQASSVTPAASIGAAGPTTKTAVRSIYACKLMLRGMKVAGPSLTKPSGR